MTVCTLVDPATKKPCDRLATHILSWSDGTDARCCAPCGAAMKEMASESFHTQVAVREITEAERAGWTRTA